MSNKPNKTLVGAFVVGAIVLLVIGIAVFGSGKFFERTTKVVMYFEGSVSGLNIGAPVVIRGVKVGSIVDISLVYNHRDVSVEIPVIAEIEPDRIEDVAEDQAMPYKGSSTDMLIEHGFRAQLQLQSMVTGQLMVELDFHPDTEVRLVGRHPKYTEIPTIPTPLQELSQTLEDIPFQEIVTNFTSTLQGIDNFVNSPELIGTFAEAQEAAKEIRILTAKINKTYDGLVTNVDGAITDIRALVHNADTSLDALGESADKTSEAANQAFAQLEETLKKFEERTSSRSALHAEITSMIAELRAAARSFRVLADYLERHPEALIRGKE